MMSSFVTNLTTIAQSFFSWFGTFVNVIVSNPVLLFVASLAIVSAVVGVVLRFINVNG